MDRIRSALSFELVSMMHCTPRLLRVYWRQLVVVLTPLLLLPLLITLGAHSEAKCAYVILIMSIFWVTEALPLPVTAILPIFAFPVLGILSAQQVCLNYMLDSNILLFGGLVFAIVIEYCHLDKRIALFILLRVGKNPRLLMGGFMLTSAFLSMWINNAAAASVLIPTIDALLDELDEKWKLPKNIIIPRITITDMEADKETSLGETNLAFHDDLVEEFKAVTSNGALADLFPAISDAEIEKLQERKKPAKKEFDIENFRRCVYLSVAYSASVGGTTTLVGSPPNLLFSGLLSKDFGDTDINFGSWMAFNLPGMIICLFCAWVWLQYLYLGISRPESNEKKLNEARKKGRIIKKVVQSKFEALGPVSYYEWIVLILGFFLVLLWVLRRPGNSFGWAQALDNMYGSRTAASDSTAVVLIILIIFAIPSNLRTSRTSKEEDASTSGKCLPWGFVQQRFPWGVLLLVGGGFAIAEGANRSNLSRWIGSRLSGLESFPIVVLVFLATFVTIFFTNIVSNNAAAAIILPVLRDLSLSLCYNPLYLMLPVVISCSYAFMLPVATPPNAVVYNAGKLKTSDMIKAGLGMNLICLIVINIMIHTLGYTLFNLNEFPTWANSTGMVHNMSCVPE